jgi:hypothetical protein
MEGELHVSIGVKVPHSIGDVLLLQLSIAVLPQVLANLPAVQIADLLPIYSLEGGVGFKFGVGGYTLPLSFYCYLCRPDMLK